MGCDIHLRVEVKDSDGNWTDGNIYDSNKEALEFYTGRNYDLFGILADVRNEHFLGPISEPRGIPDDIVEINRDYMDDYGLHSQTWFTLQELLVSYDKYGVTRQSGMISPEDNIKLLKYGTHPSSWCRSTSNDNWVKAEWYDSYNPLKKFVDAFKIVANMHWKTYKPNEIRVIIAFDN